MVNTVLDAKGGLETLPYRADDPIQGNQDNRIGNTTTTFRALLPSAFERAVRFFEVNKKQVEAGFRGKFIAIWDDTIIDSDDDFSQLAKRVYDQVGYLPIYMPLVGGQTLEHELEEGYRVTGTENSQLAEFALPIVLETWPAWER